MTARIAGYVTRAQWGAAAPLKVTELNGRRMEGVAVHHGAGANPATHAACLSTWRGYQRMHLAGARGYQSDIAYNMGVCPHGFALEGRTFARQGGANGTAPANRTYFSVCVIGTGDDVYGPAVTDALEWVIHTARTKHNAGNRVRAHRDFFSTSCPGAKLTAWVRAADGKPLTSDPAKPATDPTRPRLGDRGDLVRAVQNMLNTHGAGLDVDGVFGEKTDVALRLFQSDHGLTVDGIVGPATMAALQAPPPEPEPEPAPEPEPGLTPEQEAWRVLATSTPLFKDRTAADPDTAPRIPLGRLLENIHDDILDMKENR